MTAAFLFSVLLATEPKARTATALAPDVRTFCSSGASVTVEPRKRPGKAQFLEIKATQQRMIRLASGQVLMVRPSGPVDELLVEENGKYRRIIQSHSPIQWLAESPDGRYVAVIVLRTKQKDYLAPTPAGLYLFDTTTWIGEELVKLFGFSGLAWSPEGTRLALGDFAKLRLYDLTTKKAFEQCVFDAAAVVDTKERLRNLQWTEAKGLTVDYASPTVSQSFRVSLP